MATAARPASLSAPPGPASPWRRRAAKIGVALVLLAVAAWGAFTWLFYNPFEGRIGGLDRLIPPSAGVALRGSLAGLLAAPLVKERILARTEVEDLLRAAKIDENLRAFDQGQEQLNARLPSFVGGVDWRRDLFGGETAAFGTLAAGPGEAVIERGVVATRLSTKARMGLSLLKHGWARARAEEGGGVTIKRYPLIYEIDASAVAPEPRWAIFWAALVKDVLIVGNDRALVTDAAHLAETGGGGSLPDRPDAGTLFSTESGAPLRAWIDLARYGQDRAAANQPTLGEKAATMEGLPGLAGMFVDPDVLSTAQAVVRFPSRDEAEVEVSGIRGDAAGTGLPEAMTQGRARAGAEALREAAALAPAGSAVAAARLEVRAGALLLAAFGRLDASVREEAGKMLHEAGNSMEDVARELDDYLDAGASVVIERLPECDALSLDRFGADAEGKFVLPLPGILLAFRQRGSAGEGAAERYLRRWIEKSADRFEDCADLEGLPAGMRGFRFRPKFLTGEKELVRPAAAFEGDLVLLATNEGTLRRALAARAGKKADGTPAPALSDFEGFEAGAARCGEGQGFAFVEWGATLKMLRDGRREWATRRVEFDPVKERQRIFMEVATTFAQEKQVIAQKEVEAEVDLRMGERIKFNHEVEFPRAVEEYVRGLRALEEIRSVAAGLNWDSAGFRLGLVVRTEK
jgi:hypothetical protein